MAKPDWGELQQRFLSEHAATGVSPKEWCEAQGLNYAIPAMLGLITGVISAGGQPQPYSAIYKSMAKLEGSNTRIPDKVRAGFRAQDILARNEELIERQELNDGEGGIIEDGMIVDVAEVASAYLVPVVRQLLRRVAELEGKLRAF